MGESEWPRKLTGLHEPILVYISNIVLVGTLEGPKFGLLKAMEDRIFPPLLQKLIEFLEFFSSRLCVECSLDTVNVVTASKRAGWWEIKPKVQVSQEEQM
jgi:hypothetical protein